MSLTLFADRRIASLALVLIVPVMLAGCSNYDRDKRYATYSGWKQMDPTPQPQVVAAPVRHAVRFAPGGGEIGGVESEALDLFLNRNAVTGGGRVWLAAATPGALADRRLVAVRDRLWALGIAAGTSQPPAGGGLGADEILVTAQTTVVLAPDCPGYNQPTSFDFERRPELVMGCANAANLGLMIANPADLVQGQALAPADALAATLAIQRYQAGQVTPLEIITTK